jgi:GGDEF domain-containing protein
VSLLACPVPDLVGRLTTVVASCRQSRLPISLLLIQLDDIENLLPKFGPKQVAQFIQDVQRLIQNSIDTNVNLFVEAVSDARLGAILTGADRKEATTAARHVLEGVRKWSDRLPHGTRPLSLSMGLASLAMPPRNFPVMELVQAAERCLNGVQLSGGNGLKSIDLC